MPSPWKLGTSNPEPRFSLMYVTLHPKDLFLFVRPNPTHPPTPARFSSHQEQNGGKGEVGVKRGTRFRAPEVGDTRTISTPVTKKKKKNLLGTNEKGLPPQELIWERQRTVTSPLPHMLSSFLQRRTSPQLPR